jgi:UDP-N-acetylmuramoyl-L-alanyl-D-glutamate--2,6-diaminopimelate ligase
MNGQSAEQMDLREIFPGYTAPLPGLDIAAITTDSREAGSHGLFLACRGTRHHGLEFVGEALARGVSAVAWEPAPGIGDPRLPGHVVGLEVAGLGAQIGDIANRFFVRPSERMSVVGITGTNGKTTVAWLLVQALREFGHRPAYLGTLGHGMGLEVQPDRLTTPDCLTVHRRLRGFLDAGADFAVTEVSSHALEQGRVDGVRFRIAAFTNLTQDHLDYHGDMDTYAGAKARLFTTAAPGTAVINVGDGFGRELVARAALRAKVLTVAVAGSPSSRPPAELVARSVGVDGAGQTLELQFGGQRARLDSALPGGFNAENLAVAAGVLLAAGTGLEDAARALGKATAPPGRMERIQGYATDPLVIVDFAHTPDALRRVLGALRSLTAGALWCVFGCGGNRDRGKRPLMGAAAGELADHVIITDDNPRDEDPADIAAGVLAGVTGGARVIVLHDRARAIQEAVHRAAPGDVVLIAGKGHEKFQEIGGRYRPFSDQDVARRALESRRGRPSS